MSQAKCFRRGSSGLTHCMAKSSINDPTTADSRTLSEPMVHIRKNTKAREVPRSRRMSEPELFVLLLQAGVCTRSQVMLKDGCEALKRRMIEPCANCLFSKSLAAMLGAPHDEEKTLLGLHQPAKTWHYQITITRITGARMHVTSWNRYQQQF